MKIYILRHGQTDLNVERRLQGMLDVPLNETGVAQAGMLAGIIRGKGIRFDRIYTSPLQRAIRTGEIVTGRPASDFIREPRIAEMDFGKLEGEEYRKLPGEKKFFFTDPEHFVPEEGCETMQDLVQRMADFFEELKQEQEPPENVLLLSHGTAIHAMLVYLRGKKLGDFWDEDVHNCDVLVAELRDGEYHMLDEKISIQQEWNFLERQ